MNDFQQLKDRNFVLPQTVYRQALYAIKDLDRLRKKLEYLRSEAYDIKGRDTNDIVGQSGYVSDRMADKAVEIASTQARIKAIEDAFQTIPFEYRDGIEDKLVYDVPYDLGHSINTWKKYQQRLIFRVAVNLRII
ncbi:MAG: hypothetical protein VZR08_03360 [Anaerovoracaceae bacterium]|nr:hypothetical protein [Anaerovoracaceae bacterium]